MPGKSTRKKAANKRVGVSGRKVGRRKKQIKIVHLTNSLGQIIIWLEALREALLCLNPEMCLPCDSVGINTDGTVTTEKQDGGGVKPRGGDCPPEEE